MGPALDVGSSINNRVFTIEFRLGPAGSLIASMRRGRCDRILEVPFRPPGLSVASRIRSSRSMRPARRRAFVATALELAAGVENMDEGCVSPGTCAGRTVLLRDKERTEAGGGR